MYPCFNYTIIKSVLIKILPKPYKFQQKFAICCRVLIERKRKKLDIKIFNSWPQVKVIFWVLFRPLLLTATFIGFCSALSYWPQHLLGSVPPSVIDRNICWVLFRLLLLTPTFIGFCSAVCYWPQHLLGSVPPSLIDPNIYWFLFCGVILTAKFI
jgi:hypothetical protein